MSDTATRASERSQPVRSERAPSEPVTGSDGADATGAACIGGAESLSDAECIGGTQGAGVSDASREDWDAWQVYFETTALLTARIDEAIVVATC